MTDANPNPKPNPDQVYCLAVHGANVFCGLRSGHVQLWHCPLNAPPVMHEWRAHSGCVYALLAVGRVLVTASQVRVRARARARARARVRFSDMLPPLD